MNPRTQRAALTIAIGIVVGVVLFGIGSFTRIYAFKWGMEAYDEKSYSQASHYLHVSAFLGASRAMTLLGSMYVLARGVDRDLNKAVYWLERAADKDDIDAQSMLGTLYVTGAGIPLDMKKGIPLLERAALAGDRQAVEMLRNVQGRTR